MPIRIATSPQDAKSASRIYCAGWRAGYEGIFSPSVLRSVPMDFWEGGFIQNYKTHRFQCAVYKIDDLDVGAGEYGFSRVYDLKFGEITSIYFLPEAWGKGFARELLGFMCGQLKAMGCEAAHLWVVEENNRARRFYEKNGFARTDKRTTSSFNNESRVAVEYMRFLDDIKLTESEEESPPVLIG